MKNLNQSYLQELRKNNEGNNRANVSTSWKDNRTGVIYWIKKLEKEELLESERDFMMKFLSKLTED